MLRIKYNGVELGRIELTRHGRRELIATDEFWLAWNNNPDQLKSLGFSCRKTAKGWRAYLSPDNLAEEVVPETIVLRKDISPAFIEVRYADVKGASAGLNKRQDISPAFIEVRYADVKGASAGLNKRLFTEDERRLRYEHLRLRVDVLRNNHQSGIVLSIHDEVWRNGVRDDVPVLPRKYVITCHDCTLFESPNIQSAIETYESLASGYQ